MIVICEECGKKYRVDPSNIRGKAASFKCHACSHAIVVAKPRPISRQTPPKPKRKAMAATTTEDRLGVDGAEAEDGLSVADKGTAKARPRRRAGGFGLRAQMLLLFLFIPIILMAGISLFYLWQFETLNDRARMIALVIFGAMFLFIGIFVFVYAQRLSSKIKTLTEVAERISLGELEMEIETKSRDEIGELAEAIAKIQDSIRLSIERLRRRR